MFQNFRIFTLADVVFYFYFFFSLFLLFFFLITELVFCFSLLFLSDHLRIFIVSA